MLTTEEAPPNASHFENSEPSCVLMVLEGAQGSQRQVHPIGRVLVVGRMVAAGGLSIDDALLSRTHFRIVLDRRVRGHRLGDAGSRNGTFVNGQRVQSVSLQAGDVIRAGNTVFLYDNPTAMLDVEHAVTRLAPASLNVLVTGETGTGKERLARTLHAASGRLGPFVAINCAALPRDLLATELFGHTRGAFSGAAEARSGLLIAATKGTLLLDEIGDFPLDLQAVLLRALEERAVRQVGSDRERSIDVRVVSATHVDLRAAVQQGTFRGDLYARLAQVQLHVPSLRSRREEILTLARAFAADAGLRELPISADAAEVLVRWSWPFNIRELQSIVKAFVSLRMRESLDLAYLQRHHPDLCRGFRVDSAATNGPSPGEPQRVQLEALLQRHQGNVAAVAKDLGKPRAQIYRWLQRVGLSAETYR